jgi:hypothetical protein
MRKLDRTAPGTIVLLIIQVGAHCLFYVAQITAALKMILKTQKPLKKEPCQVLKFTGQRTQQSHAATLRQCGT